MLKLVHSFDMNYKYVLDYYNSFKNNGYDDINCYAIRMASFSEEEYFDWLYTYGSGIYYLVDSFRENFIIGFGSIDNYMQINYHKEYDLGHIAYGVRPNLRNRGYGNTILKLLLFKCEEMGMSEVSVSCNKGNVASQRIIEKNKGKFDKEFYDEFEGAGLKYWIKLKPKIKNRINRLVKRNISK